MRREKVDRRIEIEDRLRAVAVMNVPIDDGDAFELGILLLCVTCRNRDVIEQTKSHRAFFRRVMSGWTNRDERVLDLAAHDQIDCLARRARRVLRRVERTHRDCRVSVQVTGAFTDDTLDLFVKLRRMSCLDVAARRLTCLFLTKTGP